MVDMLMPSQLHRCVSGGLLVGWARLPLRVTTLLVKGLWAVSHRDSLFVRCCFGVTCAHSTDGLTKHINTYSMVLVERASKLASAKLRGSGI